MSPLRSNAGVTGKLLPAHDLLFITLDTLRFDVARRACQDGLTPEISAVIPGGAWQERHTPATFTYAAHHAFFSGFLPAPITPGKHERLFAARFQGSETTGPDTWVFDGSNIVEALEACDYRTVCIGGVGFFNKKNALGSVLPALFSESYWSEELGVTCRDSTEHQIDLAMEILASTPGRKRLFLFINVSALHQPNCMYVEGATRDTAETQLQALAYVDKHLGRLFGKIAERGPLLCILCSDHGTAYGEDGFEGHRLCHPVVWTVPYAEFVLEP